MQAWFRSEGKSAGIRGGSRLVVMSDWTATWSIAAATRATFVERRAANSKPPLQASPPARRDQRPRRCDRAFAPVDQRSGVGGWSFDERTAPARAMFEVVPGEGHAGPTRRGSSHATATPDIDRRRRSTRAREPGMSHGVRRIGFTIMELLVVMLIMGIIAATTALPSFYVSLRYHELESAARRVKLDLEQARHVARVKSQTQSLTFTGPTTYQLSPGIASLKRRNTYTVDLCGRHTISKRSPSISAIQMKKQLIRWLRKRRRWAARSHLRSATNRGRSHRQDQRPNHDHQSLTPAPMPSPIPSFVEAIRWLSSSLR